jgi:ATP-dependent DNA helicase RecG
MDIPELIRQLNATDENHKIEAKRGSAVDTTFFETVCAFANEPKLDGGFLLLGVVKDENALFSTYEIVGVDDPDTVTQQIATGCATRFNVRVRPRVETVIVKGKKVIGVYVPEASASEKPIYFANKKLPEGAYRRIGPTDQSCTEDDMAVFYGERNAESYDKTVLHDSNISDIDADAIEYYRRLKQKIRPNSDDLDWNNHDLLYAISAIKEVNNVWRPTVLGILLFGTKQAQRRLFPMMRVDYIRVNGKEWVENPDERFFTLDIRGPLLQVVQRVQTAIMDDLPKGFFLPEGSMQAENPTLSTRVLREAIVNAVMHRSYKVHGTVQVIRYSNRIEIINPGYSLKAEDQLGDPGSENRNPHLADIFYETNIAENKGSGIRAMINLLKAAQFSPPTFESDRHGNRFVARILLHHLLDSNDLSWLSNFNDFNLNEHQKASLIFLRETGALDNRSYRQFNSVDVFSATRDLRAMRAFGLLAVKGQGLGTYYLPGEAYNEIISRHSKGLKPIVAYDASTFKVIKEMPGIPIHPRLYDDIIHIRTAPSTRRQLIEDTIIALCNLTPLSSAQLALILNKKKDKLRDKYLASMIKAGALERTIPDKPFDPKQAYTVPFAH